MGRLREIPRTAAFAWSTGVAKPLLATGTRAGAVDADFSDETKLEIWDLECDTATQGSEVQSLASLVTDSRFFDIAWSQPSKDHLEGIIAGALENGSLDLWDAEKLRKNESNAFITRTSKHSGAIKALQFNPHRPELLATAGAKGELYITDLNNPENPYRVGTSAARADDFDCLDWNKKVPHILVTGSSGGFVTVWDVKARKESLTLNNHGRKPVSAVAWNPDVPTKLATAIPTDQEPLILLWNLRNSSAPERILKGHDQGVLGLSWCPQDSDLLLSCGKDNRNLCWNPHSGECVGEYPIVLNWAFQTRWNPSHPDLLATASFDGKISIQSIQNTNPKTNETAGAASQVADGEDFFAKAQTQPQVASFSLPKPPKWMECPVGVSFGFGGKIVRFQPLDEQSRRSKLCISTFTPDTTVANSISEFQNALEGEDISRMCQSRISGATSETGKEDWKIIDTLVSESPRKSILAYLGFNDAVAEQSRDVASDDKENKADVLDAKAPDTESTKSNRLSAFFDNSGEGSNFLTDLASSKGARTNNPFHVYKGAESAADKGITRNLMLGKFEDALDICLKEKRMSEAFMIAICGGQKCIDKAQAIYFSQQSNGPNYLRLLASVVGKNLWDVVYNVDLANWKEVMATLCTYADENEFPDLCEALGDRLEESDASKKDALFCYLAGSKLEKVVPIWLGEMQESESTRSEEARDESAFSIHVQSLQSFIEKVSIFRRATRYEDKAGRQDDSEWKLGSLYNKYAEYADVAAAHGYLDLADLYLSLLPEQYPSAEVARNRVRQATMKATATAKPTQRAQTRTPVNPMHSTPAPNTSRQPVAAPYMPTNNSTTPSAAAAYGPPGAGAYAPPQPFGGAYAPSGPQPGRPPSVTGPPPSGPPPPRNVNGNNWNDLPDGYSSKPPPRRTTPNPMTPPVSTPFASNPNQPPPGPYGAPNAPPSHTNPRSTPLPPPPKAGQVPLRTSSPSVDPNSHPASPPSRPASSAANAYAPASSLAPSVPPATANFATPHRSVSPYHAPPSGPPPSNRYAPAPATATGPNPPNMVAPPPTASRTVAPNPYAPSTQPATGAGPPPAAPPPPSSRGVPTGPHPSSAPRPPFAASHGAAAAPAPKYPPGDRSHIPPAAQPIYDVLNGEMQRVKARAPANFKTHVDDAEKRLNILFDSLNNEDLPQDCVEKLRTLAEAMRGRRFDEAQAVQTELATGGEVGGPWMVGVRRLISMSRATPPS